MKPRAAAGVREWDSRGRLPLLFPGVIVAQYAACQMCIIRSPGCFRRDYVTGVVACRLFQSSASSLMATASASSTDLAS
jgi:hypothetical protein